MLLKRKICMDILKDFICHCLFHCPILIFYVYKKSNIALYVLLYCF